MNFAIFNKTMDTTPVAQCLRDHLWVISVYGGPGSGG